MVEKGFYDFKEMKEDNHALNGKPVSALNLKPIKIVDETITVGDALELFKT
jgi:hypothetical protein